MVKYVSRDIICAKMMHCNFRSPDMTISDFINDELPAADVQPVKRGKWLPSDSYITTAYGTLHCEKCSECGAEVIEGDDYDNDFCPCCGARMDGDTNG